MVGCAVTDPDWLGILVSSQVIKRNLFKILAAVNCVYTIRSATILPFKQPAYICKDPSEF
jgi:hypothetical protein